MPRSVRLHQIGDLSNEESRNEILVDTMPNTELHIKVSGDETIIRLPYGNKFDIIDGCIIIHERFNPYRTQLTSKNITNEQRQKTDA
jgi:hypothetical protein